MYAAIIKEKETMNLKEGWGYIVAIGYRKERVEDYNLIYKVIIISKNYN